MAKEATQNVFLIVTRKAEKLSRQTGFAAWLHRTTTLESLNFRRVEETRKRKMQAARLPSRQPCSPLEKARAKWRLGSSVPRL